MWYVPVRASLAAFLKKSFKFIVKSKLSVILLDKGCLIFHALLF